MARFVSLLILAVDIIVIIDILRSNKDNEKKIPWIIAVVFLPVLGALFFTMCLEEIKGLIAQPFINNVKLDHV